MADLLQVQLTDGTTLTLSGPANRAHVGGPTETTTFFETPDRNAVFTVSAQAVGPEHRSLPLLFEQTDYQLTLQLGNDEAPDRLHLRIGGRELLPESARPAPRGWFSAAVNFGSEVGYTRIDLWLGHTMRLSVRIEVFPTKIDYRSDFQTLRADLQSEVRSLVFSIQGRTVQPWARHRTGQPPTPIEWLNQLENVFDDLIRSVDWIVRVPRERVITDYPLTHATRPMRGSREVRRYLRSRLSECRPTADAGVFSANGQKWQPRQLPAARRQLTPDTPENRLVVSALRQVHAKVRELQVRCTRERGATGTWSEFLERANRSLGRVRFRTVLAEVPESAHGVQPTLAMHLAPGYREFFRAWISLTASLDIGGGPLQLRERDIATLYEMWCFVALARVLRHEFSLSARAASWLRVDRRGIMVRLAKGQSSALEMADSQGRVFRVTYNHEDRTPTGTCRPDNTLEIVQENGGRRFRYLFDAKYRIRTDDDYIRDYGAPGPPIDAIQRMHAYRDQIVTDECRNRGHDNDAAVIWDLGTRRWVQQTVGAFVLFPYEGANADRNTFFRASSEVGVGSLPFLPSRRDEVVQLVKRIAHLTTETVEDTAIGLSTEAERRRIEAAHEYGLLGIVASPDQLSYIRTHRIYHTEYKQNRQLRLRADFVVLHGSESQFGRQAGAWCWARVRSVRFGERREIQPQPPPSRRAGTSPTDRYIWFELGDIVDLPTPLRYTGHSPLFGLTNRLALETAATDVFDLLLIREPERRLVQELRTAGLRVRVYDETSSTASPFDVASLRLRIVVSGANGGTSVEVRFNPRTTKFSWTGGEALWSDLMFEPHRIVGAIQVQVSNSSSAPKETVR